ncbi:MULTISPECIES: ring-opening amidohydrolase [Pseudomonadaceae]|uniref:Cyanuric acid amidohydrolase n=2 Tax=Ectopseudomonas oleovorans TaxID=301 RepID=CAH_ECTO5|nr:MULTISPECIES: ring-opening amidohydrolase [Pseudomonas]W6RJ11.1 RecName: Full=Cyanuric acid amidohydrolase; Short=CAH [Pseudomonas oleovorans CECT 5344]MCR1828552.1 ring-opening amidohydrolase [Pseudomonas oleovorans]MDG9757649.1 ring-opening amidohydrolase [Pseudomonas sediminis]MDH0569067.1 ring-opening amidohydrolase [Pseudomonas oleovorans]MDH1623796.1 ring-opening amidohydrolase [Pseudomonas chengduensis]MDH2198148.1 ring-opening amidohydrolase [Pseudomonas oleovorans]
MKTRVTRLTVAAPNDVSALAQAIESGEVDPTRVIAVLGKTEGNGCVNDFTRAFATSTLKRFFAERLALNETEVDERIAFVMSGGTEGGLSPHWLVFEVDDSAPSRDTTTPGLAAGVAFTRDLRPEEIGRTSQVELTRDAVLRAMAAAGIQRVEDVHFVQIKCPLLTAARINEAAARGQSVACHDTYESMGYSRGASALGVAAALGDLPGDVRDEQICREWSLYSSRASSSAGIELLRNEVLVLGNAPGWDPEYRIGHAVMEDALDAQAIERALASVPGGDKIKLTPERLAGLLVKAEPSASGSIRGNRHVMSDDSDINGSRHARALVGGVLAGQLGDTRLFVSGGAEHQGPNGGGPLALIVRS